MSKDTVGGEKFDHVAKCLAHVGYAAAAVAETSLSLGESVARARAAGATWTQIAKVLGISRQTASVRFTRKDS